MAKRLHDTDCWDKKWFRNLSASSKLLWLYVLDKCNCAGIWQKDLELAKFFTKTTILEKHILELSKQLKIIDLKRYLVLDFIEFQYGTLTPSHKMFSKITSELAKFNLEYPIDTVSIQLVDTVKDKDTNSICIREEDCKGETKEVTWRSSSKEYLRQLDDAYDKLINDQEAMDTQKELNPGVDIILTLRKACTNFWGTEAGWKNKKASRTKDIDWRGTLIASLSNKLNRVYSDAVDKQYGRK